jgi:hypothetical protein
MSKNQILREHSASDIFYAKLLGAIKTGAFVPKWWMRRLRITRLEEYRGVNIRLKTGSFIFKQRECSCAEKNTREEIALLFKVLFNFPLMTVIDSQMWRQMHNFYLYKNIQNIDESLTDTPQFQEFHKDLHFLQPFLAPEDENYKVQNLIAQEAFKKPIPDILKPIMNDYYISG